MKRRVRCFMTAALLLFASAAARADDNSVAPGESKSLLAPDGTVYEVRAGYTFNLGISGGGVDANSFVIEWTARRQDGSVSAGLVPGTRDPNLKRNLDLAYDESSGSLVLLWKEQISILNYLHLAVFRGGSWTQADLLPNLGFFQAYNPRILLSHQPIKYQTAEGNDVTMTRSILSIIWWEESQYAQARYAPIFLDEDLNASDVKVYDLPATIGSAGAINCGCRNPGSYMYPALGLDGPSAAILATFADLNVGKQYVLRITYPDDLGRPGPSNATWLRRRIPVVGVASEGPIAELPVLQSSVNTVIGASYKPTLFWSDGNSVGYTRFDGKNWSSIKTIPIDESMSYDRALRLVEEMGTKN